MKMKSLLALCLFASALFSSCIGFYSFYTGGSTIIESNESRHSRIKPFDITAGVTEHRGYVTVTLFVEVLNHTNTENILRYIHVEKLRVKPPVGKAIDVPDDYTIGEYYRIYNRGSAKVPPVYIDGKKIFPIGSRDWKLISILFNTITPVRTNSFRLEYAFTAVWEDGVEEKHSGTLLFKRRFDIWTLIGTIEGIGQ